MFVNWAYMYILQPQLCMGQSMAMQVIDLQIQQCFLDTSKLD